MKKISIVNSDPFFDKNKVFGNGDKFNMMYPFFHLKQALKNLDVEINTSDITPASHSDFILFNEVPKKSFDLDLLKEKKSFLLILECEIIRPENFDKNYHKHFKRVFTWDDNLIKDDPSLYVKSNFAQSLDHFPSRSIEKRKNFLCCVSANKKIIHKNELYSKRLEIIKWLEENDPESFDLYGHGWGHIKFPSNSILRPLNVLKYLPEIKTLRSSWKGAITNKFEKLSEYKFNLCLENAKGYEGYITEKIIDSFRSGCIPIYYGAPNIDSYIPRDCFINLSDYESFSSCYDHLKSLSNNDLLCYQKNMKNFLNSEDSFSFSHNSFSETIISNLELN